MQEIETEQTQIRNEFHGWKQRLTLILEPFVDLTFRCRKNYKTSYLKRTRERLNELSQVRELSNFIKSIKNANFVTNLTFKKEQKLLAYFQSNRLINANQPCSNESDSLDHYYKKKSKYLMDFCSRPPSKLDIALLRGFYTHDQTELQKLQLVFPNNHTDNQNVDVPTNRH